MKDNKKPKEEQNFPFPWEEEEKEEEYIHPEHGRVVSVRQEPYHDVTVYEDGHESWYYIGE